MKTYDPKKYDIVFAGISLNKGLADGTFLTISPTTPGFSSKVGVDGEVTRVRQHDRRATATLTLMMTSDVNDRLSAVYNADRDATNGSGVGSFLVQDQVGTTVIEDAKAYIANGPTFTMEGEASTQEWTFELPNASFTYGGSPDE